MLSAPTFRVLLYEALAGIPASVVLEADGVPDQAVLFNRGHVYTDNTNAANYARMLANKCACEIVRNPA